MFTFMFQLWLTIVTGGLVVFAVSTYIIDRRERRTAALDAAIEFAQAQMVFKIEQGDYDGQPVAKINQDFKNLIVESYCL